MGIHIVFSEGHHMDFNNQLINAIKIKDEATLLKLVQSKSGQWVNCRHGPKMLSPLHYAAEYNNKFAAELLLTVEGVDVNARDYIGMSPSMRAAYRCSEDTLACIIKDPRVDLDMRNYDGWCLEDVCGTYHSTTIHISPMLRIIKEERRDRRNCKEGQGTKRNNKRISTDNIIDVQSQKYPHLANSIESIY